MNMLINLCCNNPIILKNSENFGRMALVPLSINTRNNIKYSLFSPDYLRMRMTMRSDVDFILSAKEYCLHHPNKTTTSPHKQNP